MVLDTLDNWKKIKIADGKEGWIIANEIKLLNNF
jgi:SH3-like domain-containing protein